ncbi:MAG TPA: phage holin family protein [Gemmataceae bacterium]|nr:phage holin family protein [Gemmataceae bacterium]
MANDLHTSHEPSMTGLVTGIINDAQELLKQQFALFKQEIKDDVRKTKEAAVSFGVGLGLLAVGGLLWCWMLVHLLYWAVPSLPLWAWFGIVGLVLVAGGGVFLFLGKKRLESFHPLPEQSVGALKENVQWIMNPKK